MRKSRRWVALLCCVLLTACLPAWQHGFAGQAAADDIPFYLNGVDIVYVTETGIRYHLVSDCGNTQVSYAITAREAVRLGYTPCGRCNPPPAIRLTDVLPFTADETTVYLLVKDPDYHSSPACKGIHDSNGKYAPVPVTLGEAQYLEKYPCKKCRPPV